MKVIKLQKEQEIGHGMYGVVYRISPRRVVKVFKKFQKYNIPDEIKGSKTDKRCLPVLKVVDVVLPNGKKRKGLVKRYIPYEISMKEFFKLRDAEDFYDLHDNNVRKDSRNRIYIIDTQLNPWW
jgi:hypothetical protein